MAKIAFILLCHKDPQAVIAQARRLTAAGDFVAIHYDARAGQEGYERLRVALAGNPGVTFARRRVRCGWGEWSLVRATLLALKAAERAFPRATHFYMLSGDCMPIKPANYVHAALDADDVDYIECFDFFESGWIKTGLKEERLTYRHIFNERRHKALFYGALDLQKRMGLRRAVPAELEMRIGSQWWCLRRRTVEAVLEFCRTRRDILRFFATTWIPDETFFQTLVPHLVPAAEIRSRTLTFLIFSDYGMPVTFYNDHHDLLMGQDYLFARKISPEAHQLKRRLGELYAAKDVEVRVSGEGRQLYHFLTGQGREGRRVAPRFWEAEATLGRDRELLAVVCKKWHVGRRFADAARAATNVPAVGYLFEEEEAGLPELGGLERSLGKRTRHRRALLRLLFDRFGSDRMMICLDPSRLELLRDVAADRAGLEVLEIECDFSDGDVLAHAARVGLVGPGTPASAREALVPTVRAALAQEADALRDAGGGRFHLMRESATHEENAGAAARFLGIPEARAAEIAGNPHLFD